MNNTDTIHQLHQTMTSYIRDPLWKSIAYDPSMLSILQHHTMQRLKKILQLGPTHLIYPGAIHTRYLHSLGVMHIAYKILQTILTQNIPFYISIEEAKSFLCAALLHDIGHFPYTHSLKELTLPEHEILSAKIIKNELSTPITKWGANPQIVADSIATDSQSTTQNTQPTILFRNILSGVLDPDKLDYLCRDAFFCGVPYGIQDIDYALSQITVQEDGTITFSTQLPIEHVLFSKYLMYKSVYWHKNVRSATAMVKFALYHALTTHVIAPNDLLYLNDMSFSSLCNNQQSECLSLVQQVNNGHLYTCIAEFPYKAQYTKLEHLSFRSQLEQALSQEYNIQWVIIDLPERITFETNANNKDMIFTKDMVQQFVNTLRKLRIFVPSVIAHTIHNNNIDVQILHRIENFL